jgi:thiol-disulfide isomerase/thioredoxin
MISVSTVLVAIAFFTAPEPQIWEQVETEWGHHLTRVELTTPGGPLPFLIDMGLPADLEAFYDSQMTHDGQVGWTDAEKRKYRGTRITNGDEHIFFDSFDINYHKDQYNRLKSAHVTMSLDHYDSSFVGQEILMTHVLPNGFVDWMPRGRWLKKRGDSYATVEFTMQNAISIDDRFDPVNDVGQPALFSGRWSVNFGSSEDLAVGEFEVDENQIASGTFMTTTGDYRYLSGRVDGNLMRLSTFDGAHAFLFHARMQDDGTIEGDFWSGNWWHETWTAVRDDDAALPDAFEQTVVADEDALDDMVFKNLQGEPTRVLDVLDQSNAPARIIEIFGTWCPNCSDAGRELVSLREQYGDDLAVVGLAFEIVEDFDRSVQQVKHHHEHIGTDWPILIAGLSDKDKASQALPVLDKVRSYPTLIFLDRKNEVQGVYSGFSGPATGDAYTKQRERFEALIESMID